MDYKKELDKLEYQIKEKELEIVRLEEREKQSLIKKEGLLDKLEEKGIKTDCLEEYIMELEINLQEGITKCKNILEKNTDN